MFQITRRRLTLWYASVTALLLLILASGVYIYVRATLIERIDDTLNHVVEVVERSLVIEPTEDGLVWMLDGRVSQRVNVEASFRNNALFQNDDDRIDLEWFNALGELQWTTFAAPLPLPLHPLRREETVQISPQDREPLGDQVGDSSLGRDPLLLRQLTERVQLGRQVLGYLRVSHPWFEVTKPTRRLITDLAIGLVVLVGVVGAIGWFLSGLAMRPVQEAYQRLKQFTADASHELRNPIAMIQANVQASLGELGELETGQVSGEFSGQVSGQQQLLVVERLTRRLGRLVDDLLFLARQDSGIVEPQWSRVDLDQLLLELLEEYSLLAQEQGVNLELILPDCSDQEDFWVQGDRDQLTRVFSNLIQNALQYTPPGGSITLALSVPLSIPPDFPLRGKPHPVLSVTVTDTGPGITEEALPHIFDRFYRADPSRLRASAEGTGLGLAIVQAIVVAHQGQIKVNSHLHQGSEFTVILPRQLAMEN
jgi:two-component system, OmpR family, manganese sensing sensor histidine kinase